MFMFGVVIPNGSQLRTKLFDCPELVDEYVFETVKRL